MTTAAYRRAVDLAWENRNVSKKELLTDESRLELRQVFARAQDEHFDGLTTGFLVWLVFSSYCKVRKYFVCGKNYNEFWEMYASCGQFLVISYLAQCVIPNDFTGRPMHLEKVKGGI